MNKMDYYDEVKQRIADDSAGQGYFTTDQVIKDSGFVDFVFLGEHKGKKVVWNACAVTLRGDYYDIADNLAMEEAWERYPSAYSLEDCFVGPDEDGYYHYRDPDSDDVVAERRSFLQQRTMEHINSGNISIPAMDVEIDESYEWGVGLHVRLDVNFINVDDIVEFIKGFNAKGPSMVDDYPRQRMVTMTMDDMGLVWDEERKVIRWADGFFHDIVAIDIDSLD